MKARYALALMMGILPVGLLAACRQVAADVALSIPTTSAPPIETAVFQSPLDAPAAQVTREVYIPLSPDVCATLQQAMAEQLGVEVEQAKAPFQDYLTGETGTDCQLVATGTGQDFPHLVEVAADLGTMIKGLGWTEQPAYLADGPTGTATAFQQDSNLCLLRVD